MGQAITRHTTSLPEPHRDRDGGLHRVLFRQK
jgi:hypothetical protein